MSDAIAKQQAIFPARCLTGLHHVYRNQEPINSGEPVILLDKDGYLVASNGYILVVRKPGSFDFVGEAFSVVLPKEVSLVQYDNKALAIVDLTRMTLRISRSARHNLSKPPELTLRPNEHWPREHNVLTQWRHHLPEIETNASWSPAVYNPQLMTDTQWAMGSVWPLAFFSSRPDRAAIAFYQDKDYIALGVIMPVAAPIPAVNALIKEREAFLKPGKNGLETMSSEQTVSDNSANAPEEKGGLCS